MDPHPVGNPRGPTSPDPWHEGLALNQESLQLITCTARTATSVAHWKADYFPPDFHFWEFLHGATFPISAVGMF